MLYPLEVLTARLATGDRAPIPARVRSTAGEQRHTALSHAVISSDVQGLAALLDEAKLHSNNSEHAAKYLLGVN